MGGIKNDVKNSRPKNKEPFLKTCLQGIIQHHIYKRKGNMNEK